jgi:DEAD/DEAH box helicase domain-containing protein
MCDGRDLGACLGDKSQEWFLRRTRGMPSRAAAGLAGLAEGDAAPPPIDSFDPTVFLYDHYSGGIGLCEALQPMFPDLLHGARDRIAACPCREGCPSCVGPVQEVGPRAKAVARRLLDLLLARTAPVGAPIHPVDEPEPAARPAPEAFEP